MWLKAITRLVWAVVAGVLAFAFMIAFVVAETSETCEPDCGGFFADFGYMALAVIFAVLALISLAAALHALKTRGGDSRPADSDEPQP